MTTLRTQLEDAVVGAIEAKLDYLKFVGPYAGEASGKDEDEIFNRLQGLAPAVLVSTNDSRPDTLIQSRHVIKEVDVNLLVVSNNPRSREARNRDAGGIYQMADDLERLLLGRDVGIAGVGRLNYASESSFIHRPELAAWRIRYTVRMNAIADADDAPTLLELAGSIKFSREEDPAGTGPTIVGVNETLPE